MIYRLLVRFLKIRSNGLGVSEVVFQIAGTRRIVGEFPGLTKTDEVIAVLKETGQLEFVDFGSNYLPEGTVIQTDIGQDQAAEPSVEIPENPLEQTSGRNSKSNLPHCDDRRPD